MFSASNLLFLDIGGPEIMLILFVTLLLFGGEKLPGLARGLGKGIRDFKDASDGVKREITNQIDNYESKNKDVVAPAAVTEETHLIAEHSVDDVDGVEAMNNVTNATPLTQTHAVATDKVEIEEPPVHEKFAEATQSTDEINKEQHKL